MPRIIEIHLELFELYCAQLNLQINKCSCSCTARWALRHTALGPTG